MRKSDMDYKSAHRRYRDIAGHQYEQPVQKKSYLRNGTWHLLSDTALIAVVDSAGGVNFGDSLRAVLEVAATRKRRA